MANEGNEQVGQKNDKLRGLNLRLDAAAEDQREDQIRSHPDVQVSFVLSNTILGGCHVTSCISYQQSAGCNQHTPVYQPQ